MSKSSENNLEVKGAIFDFDGVIVNSEPFWERADRIIVEQEGKVYLPDTKNIIMGLNPMDSIRELCRIYKISTNHNILIERRADLMRQFYEDNVELNNGAYEILEYLHKNGIKMALASSTPKKLFIKALKRFNMEKFFKVIITSEDVKKSKPDPEIFIRASELLDIPKNNVFIVEDSRAGVISAISAGIKVFWLRNEDADIKGLSPDYIINSLYEIKHFIQLSNRASSHKSSIGSTTGSRYTAGSR